jgi:hypothetical protein
MLRFCSCMVDGGIIDLRQSPGVSEGIKMAAFPDVTAEVFSGIAVLVSGYSLWQTSLRRARLQVFVPPVIRYASPYQNSAFEVFEIPITAVNEGARTGTILSLDLEVTNRETGAKKQFYSAGLGPWILAKIRDEGPRPFAPLSLPGRTSYSETILFFAREDSRIQQLLEAPGLYDFAIRLITTSPGGRKAPPALTFDMNLPYMDHRAFTSGAGTLPLYRPDWQSAASVPQKVS